MKPFLLLVVASLLVATLGLQIRKRRANDDAAEDESPLESLVSFIDIIKSEDSYDESDATVQENAGMENMVQALMLLSGVNPETKKTVKDFEAFKQSVKIIAQMLKATMPEGAHATDAQLTELAKQQSKVLREHNLNYRTFLAEEGEDARLIVNTTVTLLKDFVATNAIPADGNVDNFMAVLKEKVPRVYNATKALQEWAPIQQVILKDIYVAESTMSIYFQVTEYPDLFFDIMFMNHVEEFFAQQKSEENAIESFKDFGVFVSTLKDPSSYSSFDTLYRGFARSKFLEAIALLVKNAVKCIGVPLSGTRADEMVKVLKSFLHIVKLIIADGQETDTTKIKEALDQWKREYDEQMDIIGDIRLADYVASGTDDKKDNTNLAKCMLPDKDRKIYDKIISDNLPEVSEAELEQIKKQSEVAYAIISLLNREARRTRRCVGLSVPAINYVKQTVTVPNLILSTAANFENPPDVNEKIKQLKVKNIRAFNALPTDVKKELVQEFPYQIVFALANLK